MFFMAGAVDRGVASGWSLWQQGVWFLVMMTFFAIALGPIQRLLGRDPRFAWMPLLVPLWIALLFPIAWQVNVQFGVHYLKTYLVATALMLIYGSWKRAWWVSDVWGSEAVENRVAQIVFTAIAVVLIAVAIF
jgi:hypothetical protein